VLRAGDNLVATARNISALGNLSDRYGEQIILRPLDVTDFAAAGAAVAAAVERRRGAQIHRPLALTAVFRRGENHLRLKWVSQADV